MLKKQIEYVRQKFRRQAEIVFREEKSKPVSKRQFYESVYEEVKEVFDKKEKYTDRQISLIIATNVCARLRQLRKDSGDSAIWYILADESYIISKQNA